MPLLEVRTKGYDLAQHKKTLFLHAWELIVRHLFPMLPLLNLPPPIVFRKVHSEMQIYIPEWEIQNTKGRYKIHIPNST